MRQSIRRWASLSLVVVLSVLHSAQAQSSDSSTLALAPIPLFGATQAPDSALSAQAAQSRAAKGRPWVRSHRRVTVSPAALRALAESGSAALREVLVDLPSMGPVIANLILQHPARYGPGAAVQTWSGRLQQASDSEVTMIVRNNVVTGSIRRGQVIYELTPATDGQHDLLEIDTYVLPDDHHPVFVPRSEAEAADSSTGAPAPPSAPAAAADTGSLIDVLVVYTTAAKNANGGQDGIESLINLGIALANQALANSQIPTQFRLAHTAEVAYTESGSYNTDLSRLQLTSDGFMDEVHGWRDTYKADLVTLIEDNLGGVCGVGYVMRPVSAGFARYAFSVTMDSCISSYTMAHEMGHNLGSQHDREEGGTGAYPYSFGHKEAGRFRTIMAYPCTPACTRINHYSNPLVLYQNTWQTGIDDAVDPGRSADNAKAFTNVLATVANFRSSADTTPPLAPRNLRIIGP